MSSTHLPDEIWTHIGLDLTIEALQALSATNRQLRALIASSLAIWRAVVSDLLVIVPRVSLKAVVGSASARELRAHAVQFWRVRSALTSGDENALRMETVHLPELETAVWLEVAPDTSTLVWMTIEGEVYVATNLRGHHIKKWCPSAPLSSGYEVEGIIHHSDRFGLLVCFSLDLYVGIIPHVVHQPAIWIFCVENGQPRPLLLCNNLDNKPEFFTLHGDALFLLHTLAEEPQIRVLSMLDLFAAASTRAGPPPFVTWVFPVPDHHHRVIDMCRVGDHTAIFTTNHGALLVVDLTSDFLAETPSKVRSVRVLHHMELPQSIITSGLGSSGRFESVTQDGPADDTYIAIVFGRICHITVRLSSNRGLFEVDAIHQKRLPPSANVKAFATRYGFQWMYYALGPTQSERVPWPAANARFALIFYPMPDGILEAFRRLGRDDRRSVRMSMPKPGEADHQPQVIHFDEWTGRGFVSWSTYAAHSKLSSWITVLHAVPEGGAQ